MAKAMATIPNERAAGLKHPLHGSMPDDNPMANERESDARLAKRLLEESDAKELFALYSKMVRERAELMTTIKTLSDHYVCSSDGPRYKEESESSIAAMQSVALAAIDLAKQVANLSPTH